jgi:hypothetical protein
MHYHPRITAHAEPALLPPPLLVCPDLLQVSLAAGIQGRVKACSRQLLSLRYSHLNDHQGWTLDR